MARELRHGIVMSGLLSPSGGRVVSWRGCHLLEQVRHYGTLRRRSIRTAFGGRPVGATKQKNLGMQGAVLGRLLVALPLASWLVMLTPLPRRQSPETYLQPTDHMR